MHIYPNHSFSLLINTIFFFFCVNLSPYTITNLSFINTNVYPHWLGLTFILLFTFFFTYSFFVMAIPLSLCFCHFLFPHLITFSSPNLSFSAHFLLFCEPPLPFYPSFPPHIRKVARSESARVDRHSSRRRGSSRAKQSRSRSDVDLQPPSTTSSSSPAPLSPQHLAP